MKTTVFLIRHGETPWNVLGKFQGSNDIALSEKGIVQAHQLKERFKSTFDFIYSSPLVRAYETAKILASVNEKEALIAKDLREINFGEWEGLSLKEIQETYQEAFKLWKTDKVNAPLCGGDTSLKLASIRAKECILEIINKHKGDTIAIVAHGGILKAALIGLFQWDMDMYHKMILGNTAVCEIKFDDFLNPSLVSFNDTTHLSQTHKSVSFI